MTKLSISILLLCSVLVSGVIAVPQSTYAAVDTPVYTCTVDVMQSETNCTDLVSVTYNESGQAVAKITFGKWLDQSIVRADIKAQVNAGAQGWLIDITDSDTGNGYGTDWETQSNDAELQLTAQTNKSGNTEFSWALFGNDSIPASLTRDEYRLLASRSGIAQQDVISHDVTFSIKNNSAHIHLGGPGSQYGTDTSSPYLFALAGQKDFQGPVNQDIYVGMNRVVDGDYRVGYGVSGVTIVLYAGEQPRVSRLSSLRSRRNYLQNTKKDTSLIGAPSVAEIIAFQQSVPQLGSNLLNPQLGTGFLYTTAQRAQVMIAEAARASAGATVPNTSRIIKALRRFQHRQPTQSGTLSPEAIMQLLQRDQVGGIR